MLSHMRQVDDSAVAQIQAVGRRIAELRAGRGWTQDALAERLQVSVDYVQRVERGSNLTIRSLVKIANTLVVQVIDLFGAPTSIERRPGRPPKRKRQPGS
jgi:transcriptional regulator with XRE-family HTH domain